MASGELWRRRSDDIEVQGNTERGRGREGVMRVQEVHAKLYEVLTLTEGRLIGSATSALLGGIGGAAPGHRRCCGLLPDSVGDGTVAEAAI